jgi:hypothetical protein
MDCMWQDQTWSHQMCTAAAVPAWMGWMGWMEVKFHGRASVIKRTATFRADEATFRESPSGVPPTVSM